MPLPRLACLPASADLLDAAAEHLLHCHPAPDLTGAIGVLPGHAAMSQLRARLARRAGALLGPNLTTLAGFAQTWGAEPPARSALECRLVLAEALARHPDLFPGQDLWVLTDALFGLFEELAQQEPPASAEAFAERLRRGYGARQPLAPLSREAQIVHLLWQAFREETGERSPAARRLANLRSALERLPDDRALYLIGLDELGRAECELLRPALQRPNVHLWLHGRRDGRDGAALHAVCASLGIDPESTVAPSDRRQTLLDALFAQDGRPLRERAAATPSAPPPIRVTAARSPEREARCVELAVRRCLLDGARNVAVVSDDRRLARRVRALLEHAGVVLADAGGWALSTSRAAASLDAWLEAVETRGHFRPVLELLKTPFFDGAARLAVRRLEREGFYAHRRVYLHECLPLREDPEAEALARRLDAELKRADRYRGETRRLNQWLRDLFHALEALGMWSAWQRDAAGAILAATLDELSELAQRRALPLDWHGFRRFLDGVLERATFSPAAADSPVQLLTLAQAAGARFDALVLTGASAAGLPGAPPGAPFFNQSVRAELGLPLWRERHALTLARLRARLESAPRVHVTYSADQESEEPSPSPWIEALQAFSRAACGDDLSDPELERLAVGAQADIERADADPPAPTRQPRPPAPSALLPASLSARAHQALVDCPYRFFASACLGLAPTEEPDQPRSRADFGDRVHAILHAFEDRYPDRPPGLADAALREWIERQLRQLGEEAMAPDLADNLVYRTWLEEFRAMVPALADWLAQRHAEWTHVQTETMAQRALAGIAIHGRMDRVDRSADAAAVTDYKTGRTQPRLDELRLGEAVQLPHYALLVGKVRRAELLDLNEGRSGAALEGEELDEVADGVARRLVRLMEQMRAGAPLPAWGDEAVCGRCEYAGLCRHGTWNEAAAP